MPVRLPRNPPPGATAAIAGYLQKLLGSRALPPGLEGLEPSSLRVTEGFRVYTLGLDDLLQDRPLAAAAAGRWRYFLRQADRTVAEVDLDHDPRRGPPRVVAVHRGPRSEAIDEALGTAESLGPVGRRDFELRLLEAPALHFVAVWLHGEDRDLVLPMAPNRTPLRDLRPYRESELAGVLREQAAAVRASQEGAPGPSGG